jgi:uncharacterized cofD-like protein
MNKKEKKDRKANNSWQYKLRLFILPGLKRWILFILIGIVTIVFGVLLLLKEHPVRMMLDLLNDFLGDTAHALPARISGIIALAIGGGVTFYAMVKLILSILGAYIPQGDRESIPDVLYRRRHLERGPRVVVIGGGTGLSNLLKGLKRYTNNITAIVTVGDDGGSSGRLRQELGVLPPGDMRNCITALADEEKLVTELFRYRFEQGGLEGHSFGNLFLTAVCAITSGDMVEAARVASRVLNSCGQVLPSTLQNMSLSAVLENGEVIRGESRISESKSRIIALRSDPVSPAATPAALEAILHADFIVIGPGSLYTSIIPNLLVEGIPEAIVKSKARKVYVCNVMTQKGETTGYGVADHVNALLSHANFTGGTQLGARQRFIDRVLVNSSQARVVLEGRPLTTVTCEPEKLRPLGVRAMFRDVGSIDFPGQHDPEKLAAALMLWYETRSKGRMFGGRPPKAPQIAVL